MNVAVTERFVVIETVHGFVNPEQAPENPPNVEPVLGDAET